MNEQPNRKHFIGMAGLHGCIPNFCDVYATFDDAVESLCQVHDLGPRSRFRRELKKFGYVELRLNDEKIGGIVLEGHGNEYAEIIECECDEPWVHSDSGESPFDDLPSPMQRERYAGYETKSAIYGGMHRWPGSLA